MSWRPGSEPSTRATIEQAAVPVVPQGEHEGVVDIPLSATQEVESIQLFPEDPDAAFMQGILEMADNGNTQALPTDPGDDDDDTAIPATLPYDNTEDDEYITDEYEDDFYADEDFHGSEDAPEAKPAEFYDWSADEPQFAEPVKAQLPPPSPKEVEAVLRRQAEEQARIAAAEAERKAAAERAENLRNIALHEERANRLSSIQRAAQPEVRAITVFNEADLSLPFGETLAEMVTQRANAYFAMDGQLGDIDSLDLFSNQERMSGAGKTLLVGLTEGAVEGASGKLVEELCTLRTQEEAQPSGRLGWIRAPHGGAAPTNDHAWQLIRKATETVARQSSALAHQEFFKNITVLDDGTVEHKNPLYPEKAPMEHDFDELVEALGISDDDIYKKNGNTELGFYVPLEGSDGNDPIDLIKKHADGNIANVEGFGNGAFVALVSASEFDRISESDKGGYLIFAYHPHVPGYERDTFNSKVPEGRFNIRNARPLPTMARTNVIEFSVNVWHLDSEGYGWVVNKIKSDTQRDFADPRPALRDSHHLVVEDIARRREAISKVQATRAELASGLEEVVQIFSSTSASDLEQHPELLANKVKELVSKGSGLLSLIAGTENIEQKTEDEKSEEPAVVVLPPEA